MMRSVASIYDENAEGEWKRLEKAPYQSLEFSVTMDRLARHLPGKGRVLDVGGGPGRYTVELCRRGYQVVLLDVSRGCLDLALEKIRAEPAEVRERLLDTVVGDVRDLSAIGNDSFDAVLCLDPLSYLDEPAERAKGLTELMNAATPGGMVCVSVRGYLAVLRHLLRHFQDELGKPSFTDLLRTGNAPVNGVPLHFFRSDEIRELAEAAGLETVEMAGCEGLSTGYEEETNALAQDKEAWNQWLSLVIETASDASVVDGAGHILYIGRKPT